MENDWVKANGWSVVIERLVNGAWVVSMRTVYDKYGRSKEYERAAFEQYAGAESYAMGWIKKKMRAARDGKAKKAKETT